jgi:GTPase SAR1 family protein
LIGNKCDWEEKRQVSTSQGQALADELGIPFMEVSAKSNIGVEQAFFTLAGQIKKRIIDTQATAGPGSPAGAARNNVTVGGAAGAQDQGMGGKCC